MESETANHPCRRCKKPAKGSYCEACRAKNRAYAATAKAKKKGMAVPTFTGESHNPTGTELNYPPAANSTLITANPAELAPVYYVGPDFVNHDAANLLADPHVVTTEEVKAETTRRTCWPIEPDAE